jgi:hypothetical protein
MSRNPVLSICIPTYNRAASLRATLATLFDALPQLRPGEIELCISDNASTDETQKIIREAEGHGVRLRTARQSTNLGFAGNYWAVARLASGRYVWITGDDDQFVASPLLKLLEHLRECSSDVVLINSAPWKWEAKDMPSQVISGLEQYFEKLGIFHASFIGNVILSRKLLIENYDENTVKGSMYPQMAPIYDHLRNGNCQFLNVNTHVIDDSLRAWVALQPILTSVDMARLATDHAFAESSCKLATKVRTYALLMRSLPRALYRVTHGIAKTDSTNAYQSLEYRNLVEIYRAVPLAGAAACLVALVSRLAARLLTRNPH